MGYAKFCVQAVVVGQPTWIQAKNGGNQTLELRFRADSQTYSGQQRQDFIQVRFGRNSQDAARELVPGTLAELMGTISGRIWTGERGEKIFNDFSCTEFMVLARPQYQPAYQGYAQPTQAQQTLPQTGYAQPQQPQPRQVVVTDADIPAPAAQQNQQNMDDVPF